MIKGHILLLFTFLALLTGCKKPSVHSEKINVVATTTILGDLIEHIGGPYITLKTLMGPEIDPHLYKAKASDIQLLKESKAIFYHGLHLEGYLTELFEKMTQQGYPMCDTSQSFAQEDLIFIDNYHQQPDPHVWLNPMLWKLTIPTIVHTLSEKDPTHAAFYKKQGEALSARYEKLHDWIIQTLAPLKPSQRILITSHDAFNYFGKAYDFQVMGIQGISTTAEAGFADIAQAIQFIQKHQVPAIFVENSVNPSIIEQIAHNAPVAIGGELFSDALGVKGHTLTTPEGITYDTGTYEGFLVHNVLTLLKGLSKNNTP